MIYLLLISLSILVIASFYLNDYDAIAPSFLFSASLTSGVAFAAIYAKQWELNLATNTFFVILGGVLVFTLVSFGTKSIFSKKQKLQVREDVISIESYRMSTWKLLLFLMFEVFVIIFTIYYVVVLVDGDFNNITEAIVKFRNINMFSDSQVLLPKILVYSRVAVNAAGFWFSYVLVHNSILQRKIDYLMFAIVLCSMISSFILGGRNGLINILVALVVSYFIVVNLQYGFKSNLRLKTILQLLGLLILLLFSFEALALLIGRSSFSGTSKLEYLAIYIGAPIKNLDSFLGELGSYDFQNQNQTFNHVMNWIGRKFNNPDLIFSLDLPFRTVNNRTLGNVYTTFYPYIYDFGYIGVPILVSIMAMISQGLYEYIKIGDVRKSSPLIRNVVYTYISSSLLMSFFSNKFYEQQFNTAFIQSIIIWFMFNLFFSTKYPEKVYSHIFSLLKNRGRREVEK